MPSNHRTDLPTDEDSDILWRLAYRRQGRGRGVHAYHRNALAQDIDADIVARLMRTRRNNRRARAFADDPVMLAP